MAVSAAGWLEKVREGFYASIEFQPGYEPQPASPAPGGAEPAAANGQVVLAATGLMLGRPMAGEGFPGRLRFRPYGYLRNATRRPLRVGVVVNVAAGAMAMPGAAGPLPVSQSFVVMLPPGALAPVGLAQLARGLEARLASTMGVSPGSLEGAMLNWSASFDGHDGDVLMTTGSTDQSGNYVFEVMPNSVGPEVGLQMPYWNTYGGNDTMYSLWNPGATAQNVVLTLYSADGMHTYAIPVTLAPGASTMIDVGMLRREGMPDASGNVLPPGAEDGSAMLEPAAAGKPGKNGMIKVPASGPAEMEVAVSMGIFNAQTATCCTCCTSCCVLTCPAVEDGLGFVGVGQNLAATMTAEDCCGFLEDFTDAATWSDNNGAVLASQGAGAFNALGVGSATLTAQAYLIAGSGTCNGKCHSTLVAPTGQATAKPIILVGLDGNSPSKDITNGSQSVFAGEEVQLEVDTGSTSASSAAWIIGDGTPNTDNGGWTPNGSGPFPTATSGATTTVYWIRSESVDLTVAVAGQTNWATISVAGPTTSVSSPVGTWSICSGTLGLGNADDCSPGSLGLSVDASSTSPPAGDTTSKLEWVQIVTTWTGDCTINGTQYQVTGLPATPGLDNTNPYASGSSADDSPELPLFSDATAETHNFAATMYLLWQPGLPGDEWIPLGNVSWGGTGKAAGTAGAMTVQASSTTSGGGTFTTAATFPEWPQILLNPPAGTVKCGPDSGNGKLARRRDGAFNSRLRRDTAKRRDQPAPGAPAGRRHGVPSPSKRRGQ